jgi:hypothetical protein
MDDEAFLKSFEDCSWPYNQWNHRAHLKVAYLYLRRHPLEEALKKVCAGIRAYNQSKNVPEGPAMGYHETMTQAWVRLMHFTLCEYGFAETAEAFLDQQPQMSQKNLLRFFYSKERFMSPEAKLRYLEPDLTPFPRSLKAVKI